MKADKIIVLRKGQLVEEGSHEELLKNELGVYFGLVHAQKLTLEAEEEVQQEGPEELADIQKVKTAETDRSTTAHDEAGAASNEEPDYKNHGLFRSVGLLILEQRGRWLLYTFASLGILCAGAIYPIHAWIFAQTIQVFTLTGPRFVEEGYFWAGMFGVEAAAVAVAYFALGFCCHRIAVVSVAHSIRKDLLR